MTDVLTKLKADNFKSLKDFEMPLGRFNVLIGPNGSGKTNVLEFFSLMDSCMFPLATPVYPFAYWGRYKNAVWSGNEYEPISIHIEYTIDGHDVTYNAMITGSDKGKLEILEEKIHIKDYLTVMLQDGKIDFAFDPCFARTAKPVLNEYLHKKYMHREGSGMENPNPEKGFSLLHTGSDVSILRTRVGRGWRDLDENCMMLRTFHETPSDIQIHHFLSPAIANGHKSKPLYVHAVEYLKESNSVVLLRHMDYANLRQSVPIDYSARLDDDGDGLINLLFQWFNRDQRLPDGIILALDALFPGWNVSFEITQEASIIMKVRDGQMTLAPTSIPDGFYKLLAILAAVELNPRILLIDEIETSLHARIIEYVIGVLKAAESTVIITTHSPLVVDSVDVEDLILMENAGHKSTCRKIKNPDELMQELAAKGLALSDSWLYGEL